MKINNVWRQEVMRYMLIMLLVIIQAFKLVVFPCKAYNYKVASIYIERVILNREFFLKKLYFFKKVIVMMEDRKVFYSI